MSTTTEVQTITAPAQLLEQVKNWFVKDDDMMNFFPKKFAGIGSIFDAMNFESAVSNTARHITQDAYKGGSWKFVDMDNSFFLYLDDDAPYQCYNFGNYNDYRVDSLLMSLVANLYVFSHLSMALCDSKPKLSQFYAKNYHNLKHWFYQAIDNITENETASGEEKQIAREACNALYMLID